MGRTAGRLPARRMRSSRSEADVNGRASAERSEGSLDVQAERRLRGHTTMRATTGADVCGRRRSAASAHGQDEPAVEAAGIEPAEQDGAPPNGPAAAAVVVG
ncbi:MAG: hypothetical protein K8W52_20845 [Deltaproteobacteria bacterium]|nr:hypothetical protein [Deltaproteobacteria bacterium]